MLGIKELNEPTVKLGIKAGNNPIKEVEDNVEETALEELSTSTNKEFVLFFPFAKDKKLKQNCVFFAWKRRDPNSLRLSSFFFFIYFSIELLGISYP